MTTKLLRFRSPRVCDQECPVVGDQLLLELERAGGVEILGVVRDNSLRNRLTDRIHLRGVPTTLHAEANVDGRESLLASDKDGLVNLEPQDFRLEQGDGSAIEMDKATTLFRVRNCRCGLEEEWRSTRVGGVSRDADRLGTYLLFAESLNGLRRGCHFVVRCRGLLGG